MPAGAGERLQAQAAHLLGRSRGHEAQAKAGDTVEPEAVWPMPATAGLHAKPILSPGVPPYQAYRANLIERKSKLMSRLSYLKQWIWEEHENEIPHINGAGEQIDLIIEELQTIKECVKKIGRLLNNSRI
jgi:hypothetical protein